MNLSNQAAIMMAVRHLAATTSSKKVNCCTDKQLAGRDNGYGVESADNICALNT
jgi:hypothetical protein